MFSKTKPSSKEWAEFQKKYQAAKDEIIELKKRVRNLEGQLKSQHDKLGLVVEEKEKQARARVAISAEPTQKKNIKIPSVQKNSSEKKFLEEAIGRLQFFAHTSNSQRVKLVDALEPKNFKKGYEVIKEGDEGNYLYILHSGNCDVVRNDTGKLASLSPGDVFGELALLYNCKRTASIKATSEITVFQLERQFYQAIIQLSGAAEEEERYNLLKTVKSIGTLPESNLRKIAEALQTDEFSDNSCIIRQGTQGDNFYIIKEGKVRVPYLETENNFPAVR